MFDCMFGCMRNDWLGILGWTLLGTVIGAAIGFGSLTVTGGISWPSILFGAGAGAFLGFAFGFGMSWNRCWPTCDR